jgi:hypothetical protein
MASESIGKVYKPWIIVSLALLVGSLLVLAADMAYAFLYHAGQDTPLWVIVIAVIAGLGLLAGFAGFFLLMMVAGWSSWRATRRIQVLPPESSSR